MFFFISSPQSLIHIHRFIAQSHPRLLNLSREIVQRPIGLDSWMVTKEMRVGKYELGRTLGEGNSANVKLARDTVSGQSFAVKIIDKSRISRLNVSLQVVPFSISSFLL